MNALPTPIPLQSRNLQHCIAVANRVEALKLVPKHGVAVEIGVGYGDFSQRIIDHMDPSIFYAVDSFGFKAGAEPWGVKYLETSGLSHFDYYNQRYKQQIAEGRVVPKQGLSWDVLKEFSDDYFDFIYLDADHRYDSVKRDVEVIKSKVKNNGYIQFNDYTLWDHIGNQEYGVVHVANEFISSGKHQVVCFCFEKQGYYDVLVQVIK